MSDKINEQTEKMREMAQTTLDKAKEAVSKYMTEPQKLREKADFGVRATYSTAKDMSEKAVAFAESNVAAGFELAQRLLQAKDPQEIGADYQRSSQGTDGKDECSVSRSRKCDEPTTGSRP